MGKTDAASTMKKRRQPGRAPIGPEGRVDQCKAALQAKCRTSHEVSKFTGIARCTTYLRRLEVRGEARKVRSVSFPGSNQHGYEWELVKKPVPSSSLADRFPIIPHESAGVDCCGSIVPAPDGERVRLKCNECGVVAGEINAGILEDLVSLVK
jgi:hypothetical protein